MLRLRLPEEVRASESKCQRSKVTGSLLVVMPCVKSSDKRTPIFVSPKQQQQILKQKNDNMKSKVSNSNTKTKLQPKKLSLQEEMIAAAAGSLAQEPSGLRSTQSTQAVDIRNIVPSITENNRLEDTSALTSEGGEMSGKTKLVQEMQGHEAATSIADIDY